MADTAARFDPWQQLARLEQQMDQFLGRTSFGRRTPSEMFMPPVDGYVTDEEVVYKLDLPGMEPEDLHIELAGHVLRVTGERSTESETEHDGWVTRERSHGTFARRFAVPEGIDEDDVKAEFAKGVLTITVPRPSAPSSKRIEITGETG